MLWTVAALLVLHQPSLCYFATRGSPRAGVPRVSPPIPDKEGVGRPARHCGTGQLWMAVMAAVTTNRPVTVNALSALLPRPA